MLVAKSGGHESGSTGGLGAFGPRIPITLVSRPVGLGLSQGLVPLDMAAFAEHWKSETRMTARLSDNIIYIKLSTDLLHQIAKAPFIIQAMLILVAWLKYRVPLLGF